MSIGIDDSMKARISRGVCVRCSKVVIKNNQNQVKYWCNKICRKLWRHGQ